MNKTCVIGIPTYRRPEICLTKVKDFLRIINSNNYNVIFKIYVADNSKIENHELQKLSEKGEIKYFWDGNNYGYGGNIRRLIENSINSYLWLTGDDDQINADAFFHVDKYLDKVNNFGYITFSSVLSRETFDNKLPSIHTNDIYVRLKTDSFLEQFWESVVFISANLMFIKKEDILDRKISMVYENSVFAFNVLSKQSEVDIIMTDTPIDSYTVKNYSSIERFRISVIDYLDVVEAIYKLNPKKSLKNKINKLMMKKMIYCIKFSILFDNYFSVDSLFRSLFELSKRLLKFNQKISFLFFNLSITIYVIFIINIFLFFLKKILNKKIRNKIFILLFGKKAFKNYEAYMQKIVKGESINYYKD